MTDYELESIQLLTSIEALLTEQSTTLLAIYTWGILFLKLLGIIIAFLLAVWFVNRYVVGIFRRTVKF